MTPKITMRDVAEKANVSVSTVSHVLNNKLNVSPHTRHLVLEAARQIGYLKNRNVNAPSATSVSSLSTVGLLTSNIHDGTSILTNTFFSQIIANIERESQRSNLSLMYANLEVDESGQAQGMPPMLLDELVDGIIVVGFFTDETITNLYKRSRKRMVLVDTYAPSDLALESILIDNLQGATHAVSHLIENGHRKIGLIGSHVNDHPSIAQRREAYFHTLAQHNIQETYVEESNLQVEVSYEATLRLMEKHPDITAIFACNDEMAAKAVMPALQKLNYRIPEDISLIGFDDTDIARIVKPALTTIHVDRELMGTLAVQRLIERVNNPDRSAIKNVIGTCLVMRDTVKNIAD